MRAAPPRRRWSSLNVVLILLAVLVVIAMVLALALDGGGSADTRLTDLFSKILEMFSLGITFALVVLAINAFRLQADLERMRAASEAQIEKLITKEQRLDQMFVMIWKTLHVVQEILLDLVNKTSPTESIPGHTGAEEEMADEVARLRERRTLPIYWRSRVISLLMAQSAPEKIDFCRDIIGTMEGADTDIVDADILDIVSDALSEVIGTRGRDLSKDQSVGLADVKRHAHALQRIAWEIEARLPPPEPEP